MYPTKDDTLLAFPVYRQELDHEVGVETGIVELVVAAKEPLVHGLHASDPTLVDLFQREGHSKRRHVGTYISAKANVSASWETRVVRMVVVVVVVG